MSQEQLNRMLSIVRREPIDYYTLLGIERGNYTLDDLTLCKRKYNKILHPDVSEHEVNPEMVAKYAEVLKAVNAGLAELKSRISGPKEWNPSPDPNPTPEPTSKEEKKTVGYSKLWNIRGGIPFAENIEYQGYNETFLGLIKEISNLERFYKNTANKYGDENAQAVFHKYICKGSISGFTRDPQTRDRTAIDGIDRSSIIKILLQHALMNYIVGNKVPGKVINNPNFSNKNKKLLMFFSSINFYEMTPEKLLEAIYEDQDLANSLLGNLNYEYSVPSSEIFQCYKEEMTRNPELASFMNKLNSYYINNPDLEKVNYTYREKKRVNAPFESIMGDKINGQEILYSIHSLDEAGNRTNNKYKNAGLYEDALSNFFKTGNINGFSRNPKTGGREELEKISRSDLIKVGIAHSFMNYMIGNKLDGEGFKNPLLGIKKEIYDCINDLNLGDMTTPELFIQAVIKDKKLAMSLMRNIDYRYFDKNTHISSSYINIIQGNNMTSKEKEILAFMKRLDTYINMIGDIPFNNNSDYEQQRERGWKN